MVKFLVLFIHKVTEFRLPELDSVAELFGHQIIYEPKELEDTDVFLTVDFPSKEAAIQIISRCITIKAMYEIIAQGKSYEETKESLKSFVKENPSKYNEYFGAETTFKLVVESFGKRYQQNEKIDLAKGIFESIDTLGKVKLTEPEHEFTILESYPVPVYEPGEKSNARKPTPLRICYFTKKICEGCRHLLHTYDLRTRGYIGTTSMTALLSFLVANQAKCIQGSYVMDPFCGTGSLIVSCAHFGSIVLGSDLDIRVLRGKSKGVIDNFKQYNLVSKSAVDLVRTDMSMNNVWRFNNTLDAIVCDPPYGIRAGARKIGKENCKPVPENLTDSHYAASMPYSFDDLLDDLFEFAARSLVVGGRLVYWTPGPLNFKAEDAKKHDRFKRIAVSGEVLSTKTQRILITMEKTK